MMRILVLHGVENVNWVAKSVTDLELSIPSYLPKHQFIFHCYKHPFFPPLADLKYDGIIIWSTFLDARHLPETYERVRREYEFVAHSSAVKIALPQDEYYCNELLDQWMVDWKVDCVYTVLYDHKEELLPQYLLSDGQIRYGYTGYIDQSLLKNSSNVRSFDSRSVDVSYRASGTPTNLNELAMFKAQIGDNFIREFARYDLKLDISVKPEDFISGREWFDFIGNSRFVLGVNSGSSVRIPDLEISQKVRRYQADNPTVKYEELVRKFLRAGDEKYYTAISPRNIEAALLGSCQITTALGPYSGLLEPGENFISIEQDCSNHEEVVEQMNDRDLVQRMITSSRELILSCSGLRIENLYTDLEATIMSGKHTTDSFDPSFVMVKARHNFFIRKHIAHQNWKDWKTHSPIAKGIKKIVRYRSQIQ